MSLGLGNVFVFYQHPKYIETTAEFERRYGFFSAGIVLLEIGLWCTISDLFDTKVLPHPSDEMSAEQNRSALRKKHGPQLRHRMGKSYQDAVVFGLESLKDNEEALCSSTSISR